MENTKPNTEQRLALHKMLDNHLSSESMAQAERQVRLALLEMQKVTRHAAVEKVNAIVSRWNEKHPMDENVESLLNEITGALFNLRDQ
jgi:hypothetical protein